MCAACAARRGPCSPALGLRSPSSARQPEPTAADDGHGHAAYAARQAPRSCQQRARSASPSARATHAKAAHATTIIAATKTFILRSLPSCRLLLLLLCCWNCNLAALFKLQLLSRLLLLQQSLQAPLLKTEPAGSLLLLLLLLRLLLLLLLLLLQALRIASGKY